MGRVFDTVRITESEARHRHDGLGGYMASLFFVGVLGAASYGTVEVLNASKELDELETSGAPDSEQQDARDDIKRGWIIFTGSFAVGAAGAIKMVVYDATTGFEERERLISGTIENPQA